MKDGQERSNGAGTCNKFLCHIKYKSTRYKVLLDVFDINVTIRHHTASEDIDADGAVQAMALGPSLREGYAHHLLNCSVI